MATVEYANYHKDYDKNTNVDQTIISESSPIFPDEYKDDEHYKKIFCPRCKEALKRTPKLENKTSNGIDAFFSHFKSKIECPWHIKTTPGKKYLNDEDTWHAIEDENLTVLTRWSDVVHEEGGNQEQPVYDGVNEDPLSDETTDRALGRYHGADIPLPNRITSVRTLAININAYKYKAIILPGKDHAVEIQSLLRALDADEFTLDHEDYLFFGRVNSFYPGDEKKGPYDFINIKNDKQKTRIYVPKKISNSRKFSADTTKGRVVIVYGKLEFKNDRYIIVVKQLGQIAYVPKDKEKFFWYRKKEKNQS